MSAQVDAIIVGGGVIGCSAAYYLSLKGLKVMLLEKGRIGQEASGAAAGMLGAQSELTEDGPLWKLARCSRDLFPRLAEELRELSGIDIALVQRGMLKVAVTEQDAAELKRLLDLQQQAGRASACGAASRCSALLWLRCWPGRGSLFRPWKRPNGSAHGAVYARRRRMACLILAPLPSIPACM
ncbi:FAD-dependent oxidoreductase [Paenibacillus larvae]|nr:FAD-dependent oxidoreductase [Paenibacillus larvae]MDT2256495.1 FAD-dependent oxidoreductase [Paenibacillus larvae]MDT2258866.1 FAD-dependent oxidoreductase [Paenibacillus larvae]MDT2303438.1 FAD-dependent oxidoreductase [Paenibacillus larvae]